MKQDFSFAGTWLSELGGRIKESPKYEIAERDIELVEIPGRSGDVFLDKKRYKNVPFERSIAFVNDRKLPTRQQIEKAIDWLGYNIGYQEFRDTLHPRAFTNAVLLNASEVIRDLPRLTTAKLSFNREPFWFSDEGQRWYSFGQKNSIKLSNPYQFESDADFIISALPCTTDININGIFYKNVTFSEETPTFLIDRKINQIVLINLDTKRYKVVTGGFPLPLSHGENEIVIEFSNKNISLTEVKIKPNWRFL